jgi:hypothetical protein
LGVAVSEVKKWKAAILVLMILAFQNSEMQPVIWHSLVFPIIFGVRSIEVNFGKFSIFWKFQPFQWCLEKLTLEFFKIHENSWETYAALPWDDAKIWVVFQSSLTA